MENIFRPDIALVHFCQAIGSPSFGAPAKMLSEKNISIPGEGGGGGGSYAPLLPQLRYFSTATELIKIDLPPYVGALPLSAGRSPWERRTPIWNPPRSHKRPASGRQRQNERGKQGVYSKRRVRGGDFCQWCGRRRDEKVLKCAYPLTRNTLWAAP